MGKLQGQRERRHRVAAIPKRKAIRIVWKMKGYRVDFSGWERVQKVKVELQQGEREEIQGPGSCGRLFGSKEETSTSNRSNRHGEWRDAAGSIRNACVENTWVVEGADAQVVRDGRDSHRQGELATHTTTESWAVDSPGTTGPAPAPGHKFIPIHLRVECRGTVNGLSR